MQKAIQNPECRRWLVVAILFCLVVGVIVWCCRPREYSLADPRRYVALEEIPVGRKFFSNGDWDYNKLAFYGVQISTADEEIRFRQRDWTIDFLKRVNDDKNAVVRYYENESGYISEIRYRAITNDFLITVDNRSRNDRYRKYGVVSHRYPFLRYRENFMWLHLMAEPMDAINPDESITPAMIMVILFGEHNELDALISALDEKGLIVEETK